MKKLFISVALVSLMGFLVTVPITKAATQTTTSNDVNSLLEQLITLLTNQLRQLEQQLALQQQQINALQNVSSQSTLTQASSSAQTQNRDSSIVQLPQTTSATEAVFSDLIIQATSTRPMPSYGDDGEVYFSFKTLSPNGEIFPGAHLHINGTFYVSDANGLISLDLTSRTNTTFQFVLTDEGWPLQAAQTITLTPPPYIPTSWYPPNYTDPCAPHYIGPIIKTSGHLTCA